MTAKFWRAPASKTEFESYCLGSRMGECLEEDLLRIAQEQADLGLPLGPTRLRRLKRLIVRLCWVFLSRQVAYNHEVIRALGLLAEQSATRQSADEELQREIAWIQSYVFSGRHDARGVTSAEVDVLWSELNALREELLRSSGATRSDVSTEQTERPALSRSGSSLITQGGRRPTLSLCCVTRDASPPVVALLDQWRLVADEIFVAVDNRADLASLKPLVTVADRVKRFEYAPPLERTLAWAHAQCRGDWVLRIDSDEVASPALVDALPELIRAKDVVYYAFPFRWLYPDIRSWLDEYPWSSDYHIRLVRNDPALLWHDGVLHHGTIAGGPGRYLEHAIYHLNCATSTREDRETKLASYRSDHLQPERSGPDHLYLPERFATKQPQPVPPGDQDAIAEVVGAPEHAPGLLPEFFEIPVARRDEIDSHWDRRPLTEDTYQASIEVLEKDIQIPTNWRQFLHVRVTNRGHDRWPGGFDRQPLICIGYHWCGLDGSDVAEGSERSYLTAAVSPGTSSVVPVAVDAPEYSGAYVLEVDLVHEGVRWFDCPARVEVTITADPPRWLTGHPG